MPSSSSSSMPIILAAAGAAAYFLFFRSAPEAPEAQPAPTGGSGATGSGATTPTPTTTINPPATTPTPTAPTSALRALAGQDTQNADQWNWFAKSILGSDQPDPDLYLPDEFDRFGTMTVAQYLAYRQAAGISNAGLSMGRNFAPFGGLAASSGLGAFFRRPYAA